MTLGDCYELEIYEIRLLAKESIPTPYAEERFQILINRAPPSHIRAVIYLSSELNRDQQRKRKEFYHRHLKGHPFRFGH